LFKTGPSLTLQAIQAIQSRSLQILATRRAALELASCPDTSLSFCGHVAITTNTATLIPLCIAGKTARAVAILAATQKKEKKQPLQFYVTEFPPKSLEPHFLLARILIGSKNFK
jgi:hypothetical protein